MSRTAQLYLVATPIGNLEDMSPRVVRTLSEVDFIAAEDTRVLRKLLTYLGLSKKCFSYREHNRVSQTAKILKLLAEGQSVALVSDAGMPLISDPGAELVQAVHEAGFPLTVIPGPSAVLTALAISGLATSRFIFEGFLPPTGEERRRRIMSLQGEERSAVIFEAPHRLLRTLNDLRKYLGGERRIALTRELTKIHEEVLLSSIDELVTSLEGSAIKGECVLVLAGAKPVIPSTGDPDRAFLLFHDLVASGMERRYALKEAARRTGIGRDELYQLIIEERR